MSEPLLISICIAAVPLLLASMGALASELSGAMAVFADGLINLSAFFCFAFTVQLGRIPLFAAHPIAAALTGILLSVCLCMILIYLLTLFTRRTGATPFLTALAVNSLSSAVISIFSSVMFGTRGVLTSAHFRFTPAFSRTGIALAAWILTVLFIIFLRYTRGGLYLRITGGDEAVLEARGVRADTWKTAGWCLAAAGSAAAGCALVLRLQAFVPNISTGRGWMALAAVFLGRKTSLGTAAAALVFSLAEYAANNAQNLPLLRSLSPAFILSLPYLFVLILILSIPSSTKKISDIVSHIFNRKRQSK